MTKLQLTTSVVVVCLLLISTNGLPASMESREASIDVPKMILLSFDGFRHDYMEIYGETVLSNFFKFWKKGTRAPYIKSVYPTTTLANHMTLVTGLYAESHGAVGNRMWDPELGEYCAWCEGKMDDNNLEKNSHWFEKAGYPLWWANQVAHSQSAPRGSAVINWPTAAWRFRSVVPDYYKSWSANFSYEQDIDRCIDLLMNGLSKTVAINYVQLYFSEPDETGHKYGPFSAEMKAKLAELNGALGYLLERLNATGLEATTNLIVTSDHGMATLRNNSFIDVVDFVDLPLFKSVFESGLNVSDASMIDQVVAALQKAKPTLQTLKKSTIPERFHFRYNSRIPEAILMPGVGSYYVKGNEGSYKRGDPNGKRGTHNYSPDYPQMWPVFLAKGPAIKSAFEIEPFENVDIYPLALHLLDLSSYPSNGSLERASPMLRTAPVRPLAGFFSAEMMDCFQMFLIKYNGWAVLAAFTVLVIAVTSCCCRCCCTGGRRKSKDANFEKPIKMLRSREGRGRRRDAEYMEPLLEDEAEA